MPLLPLSSDGSIPRNHCSQLHRQTHDLLLLVGAALQSIALRFLATYPGRVAKPGAFSPGVLTETSGQGFEALVRLRSGWASRSRDAVRLSDLWWRWRHRVAVAARCSRAARRSRWRCDQAQRSAVLECWRGRARLARTSRCAGRGHARRLVREAFSRWREGVVGAVTSRLHYVRAVRAFARAEMRRALRLWAAAHARILRRVVAVRKISRVDSYRLIFEKVSSYCPSLPV